MQILQEQRQEIIIHTKPTLIDLFSGCGGITQGFKNARFSVLAAVEWDQIVARSYSINHPEVMMYGKNIQDVEPQQLLQDCHLEPGQLTVLSVCAPCQPFSRQTRLARIDDRTELVLEMVRFVDILRPKFAIMENVPGLNKGKNKAILDKLVERLRKEVGYSVLTPQVVDSVNYGTPQFRKRLILLCSREPLNLSIPPETYVHPTIAQLEGKTAWKTVKEAFKGVHSLAAGQQSRTDPLHRARQHSELNLKRIRHIPKDGGSRTSLPAELQLKCHESTDGYYDVYGRMDSNRPANTLTTGCTNFTKGRFAHPTANRAITLREAARLQTFPDEYLFVGNYDQISAQIGNAVPVVLAETFGRYFHELYNMK